LSYYMTNELYKKRKLVMKLAKKLKLYYLLIIVIIVYLFFNHTQLRELVIKPPAYVYILSLFLGLTAYFGNMYKEKIEGMKMLTEAVKTYLDNAIHAVDLKVGSLDVRVTNIEAHITTIETDVKDILTILRSQQPKTNP
jgi:hypothetical protein